MKQQILVTGANGFVGRNLCRDLAARGYGLRGTLRAGRPKLIAGIDYREVPSLEDNPDWRPHLDGCDGVVHCAALVHAPSRPGQAERLRHLTQNAEASEQLARQAREAGLSRMGFISLLGSRGCVSLVPVHRGQRPGMASPFYQSGCAVERAPNPI